MTAPVFLHTAAFDEITVNLREAARYLGMGSAVPEDETLFDAAKEELRRTASLRACYCVLPVTVADGTVDFGVFSVQSCDLSKNLSGCKEAILFAATLGAGADRSILRLKKTDPASAMVLDAYCSAAAEGWCDRLEADLTGGRPHRPRFSPGYGDVSLSLQRVLFQTLDATRKLGVTLSASCFMTPTKSVTAFIGLEQGERI